MPSITLHNVSKEYDLGSTRVPALRGVNLTIAQGELLALWGPSGSGKSTLCNLVGLLDAPCAGSVKFGDQDVSALDDNDRSEMRNSQIGFIFQGFNLVAVLSALENVMLPLQIRGRSVSQAATLAREALDTVGLTDFVKHRPSELSGGQQQRVAIARALIGDPSIVIADEPTANLDTETAYGIKQLIARINTERNTTFLFATHDQRLLAGMRRKVLLKDGQVMEDSVAQ